MSRKGVERLQQLITQGYDALRRQVAYRLGGSSDMASDALHEAYVRLASQDNLDEVRHPHAYLVNTAVNVAIDRIRSDARLLAPAIAPAPLPPGTLALCWGAGDWDPDRSVPEPMFAPFCRGPALSLMPGPTALPVLNPQGCPLDIRRTAELVAGAAGVVTVDTMIAHLAGMLGRPVCLLVKHRPDWRWPVRGRRTPWYPTMRVWRQPAPGDWAGAIGPAAAALDGLPGSLPNEKGIA